MTDNEIIRIAENCCSDKPNCTCCPFDVGTNTVDECMEKLIQHCVDLINRQKAENERLNKEVNKQQLRRQMYRSTVEEIKSEAIKEFAERLKERATGMLLMGERFSSVDTDDINNLVNEMCGE